MKEHSQSMSLTRTIKTAAFHLGALLTLATFVGCSAPISLEADVTYHVVRHLGKLVEGQELVAPQGFELRGVKVSAVDGTPLARRAAEARREFGLELASPRGEAIRPTLGQLPQSLDLSIELLPVFLEGSEVVSDGAKVVLHLERPGGERVKIPLTVRREFSGGYVAAALYTR